MKRNRVITLLIALAIVSIIAGALVGVSIKQTITDSVSYDIEILNGKSNVTEFSVPLELKHGGNYSFSINFSFDTEPGFLTAFELVDSSNQTINWQSAQWVSIEDATFKLPKGSNRLKFTIITDNTQYEELFNTHLANSNPMFSFEPWDRFSDGSTTMQYDIRLERSYKDVGAIIAVFACIAGACAGAALSMSLRKGEKAKGDYDERMEIARRKSESHAFYVMLAGLVLLFTLNYNGLSIPITFSAQVMFVLCVGLSVMAVEGILNDGYFALNDRKRGFIILFLIMFLLTGGTSVFMILNGQMVVGGVLQNSSCFIFLALMSLSCVIAELVHDMREKAED